MGLNSIFAIQKRDTHRFKTRLTGLSGKSLYQKKFIDDQPTPLGQTDTNFAFSMNDDGDLFAIQMSGFDADPNLDRTSLYILDRDSSWMQFLTKENPTPTSLSQTDNSWDFAMRGSDLFAFDKTDLRTHFIFDVRVVVLLSLYNYLNSHDNHNGLEFGIPVPLQGPSERLSALSFGIANNDIVVIKKRYTRNGRVEVHILDQNKNYQKFKPYVETPIAEIPLDEDSHWKFLIGYGGDLVIIHKRNTESKKTEVQILSAPNYQKFTLPVTPTPLDETNDTFDFVTPIEQEWEPQSPPDGAPLKDRTGCTPMRSTRTMPD
jgi:hypothetical protein